MIQFQNRFANCPIRGSVPTEVEAFEARVPSGIRVQPMISRGFRCSRVMNKNIRRGSSPCRGSRVRDHKAMVQPQEWLRNHRLGAMTIRPWSMCPLMKFLGSCVPCLTRPLEVTFLIDVSRPWCFSLVILKATIIIDDDDVYDDDNDWQWWWLEQGGQVQRGGGCCQPSSGHHALHSTKVRNREMDNISRGHWGRYSRVTADRENWNWDERRRQESVRKLSRVAFWEFIRALQPDINICCPPQTSAPH
jgi:hypothetical protein